jgi:hypothetical protein
MFGCKMFEVLQLMVMGITHGSPAPIPFAPERVEGNKRGESIGRGMH